MQIKIAAPTNRFFIVTLVLVSFLSGISSLTMADDKLIELKVGYLEIPPLYTTQTGARPTGELADILFGTLDKAGFSYSYQVFPPTRLYKNMASGATDLSTAIKGQALYDNNVMFGKKVLMYLEQRIYAMGDRPIPVTVDGLLGKKIALKRDYGYGGDYVKLTAPGNLPFVAPVNSPEHALAMLQSGRVDFVLDYKDPVTALIETLHIPNVHYKTIRKIPVYFLISRRTPNYQQILRALDDHFVPALPLHH